MLKPSELTPASSNWLASVLAPQLSDVLLVYEGPASVSEAILEHRFDLVFFTGSPRVGRLVSAAAARLLTPCVMELGGKSPAIVGAGVNSVELASERICWAKIQNAGQTCMAPDYVLVDEKHLSSFVSHAQRTLKSFYPDGPRSSPDLGRIVSEAHTQRLASLLEDNGSRIIHGGETDIPGRYVAPTLILNPALDSPIMQEEIFGPILPIITYKTTEECVQIAKTSISPLATYIFDARSRWRNDLVGALPSTGMVVFNDAYVQAGCCDLPFGGAGTSGHGAYFGEHSYEAFTRKQSVLTANDWLWLERTGIDIVRNPPSSNRLYGIDSFSILRFAILHLPDVDMGITVPNLARAIGVMATLGVGFAAGVVWKRR